MRSLGCIDIILCIEREPSNTHNRQKDVYVSIFRSFIINEKKKKQQEASET